MFIPRDQQAMHYALWATQVPRADHLPADFIDQYVGLDGETARRAAFFSAVARHGFPQGLQNQFVPEALVLEPYHPYLAREVPGRLAAIAGGDLDATEALVAGGFDILHLPLLRSYGPSIVDSAGVADHGDVWLDPAYGYVYPSRQDPRDFVPLALSHWVQRLGARREKDYGLQHLTAAAGDPASLLTAGIEEGAFIGAELFKRFGVHVDPPNAVPELPVANEREFTLFVDALRFAADQAGGLQLWFRGQTREYAVEPIVGLASGPRSRRRPSLVPGLFRELQRRTDDLDTYRDLVLRFGRWSYWASTHLPLPSQPTIEDAPAAGFAATWESRRTYYDEQGELVGQESQFYPSGLTELGHGLILQHYGAPTGYIDITSDPEIALWFALNRLVDGRYERHGWTGDDPLSWPVVYVMALLGGTHPFIDSAALLRNTDAARPQHQSCGLLGGSGNLFRNFPASFVAVVLRLKPGFVVSQPRATSEIFPGPDADPFLRRLLADESSVAARDPADSLFPVTVYC